MKNLRELPRFRDGLSYIYVEHGRIEQEAKAIAWWSPDGIVSIPCAALGVLFLGPGTTITHAAVKALADCGCSICWTGEDATRFYASGTGETRSSAALVRQAAAWADPVKHLRVVHTMYSMRFAGGLSNDLTLQQIRGMEGVRVRDSYAKASRETGVPWHGRKYHRGNWSAADPLNRALSAGTACLYGVCHAAIVTAGYSPALGFIHTGKQLSFVYDIADLYKTDTVIPAAFETVAESPARVEAQIRRTLREQLRIHRVLERAVADLHSLFGGEELDVYAVDGAKPGNLWDLKEDVAGGVRYGCAGPGESADESSR